jgi:hypothetical protein
MHDSGVRIREPSSRCSPRHLCIPPGLLARDASKIKTNESVRGKVDSESPDRRLHTSTPVRRGCQFLDRTKAEERCGTSFVARVKPSRSNCWMSQTDTFLDPWKKLRLALRAGGSLAKRGTEPRLGQQLHRFIFVPSSVKDTVLDDRSERAHVTIPKPIIYNFKLRDRNNVLYSIETEREVIY